jgi:hypothetical protein
MHRVTVPYNPNFDITTWAAILHWPTGEFVVLASMRKRKRLLALVHQSLPQEIVSEMVESKPIRVFGQGFI